jgi:uncharacterized protein YndB with AHSA1/START domain
MLKKILLVVAAAIVLLLGYAATIPGDFRVERSATIAASPEAVFPLVNNLHEWKAWSPWAKLDPNAKESFAGPDTGTGAEMSWSGNGEVGEGKMTITESKENERVAFKLDFTKPFVGTNLAEFTFKPDAGGTQVTWSMTGKKGYLLKVASLVMNCDKMVGDQFEQGLASMKAIAEKK